MMRYGSDVMVDAIKACGFKYVSLNPGSSYRGLHDSLVNYGGNDPEIITCNHEKLAVGIAHGYAKAAREPMACVLHDIVGLLQGTMGVYYAWIDRAPVVVFGGAGPMAYDRRRPNIDWIHTASIQGNVVRDYTKWDDQPYSVASVPESIMRAYRIASAQPQGPTYIALDAGLQEDELDAEVPLPDWNRLRTPSSVGPDPAALRRLAQPHETDLQVTADSAVALPLLLDLCRELNRETRDGWRRRLAGFHDETWRAWAAQAQSESSLSPVSTSRLAAEVWEVVREHDWVLTAGTASGWAPKVWDFDREYRHPGASLGTTTQIGISLGVGLAHKGSGRLVVDLQPDGDLMFDLGALWVAAYHRIPLLAVMFNNRAYYNDWEHQERIANARGTDVKRAYIGMEIDKPAPDFAAAARAMGWFGEGPIDDPDEVQAAVRRAADAVLQEGRPALVDVVCQYD